MDRCFAARYCADAQEALVKEKEKIWKSEILFISEMALKRKMAWQVRKRESRYERFYPNNTKRQKASHLLADLYD